MNCVSQLLRLNARVGVLALRGRWLTGQEYGRGYDKVAPTYNSAWQCHLRPVTDILLGRLPAGLTGTIVDLGCGTGYAATWLARNNPQAKIIGVDISAGMLAQASRNALANVEFLQQDMLSFTRGLPAGSVRAIVSAWALGYSHPAALFAECHRVLARGTLAFVVNYFDTLAPVFRAFQKCMLHYPERVRLAAWPRFPRNWRTLEHALTHAGFNIEWHEDGEAKVTPPPGPVVPWLRQTGILAGFDAMLDLSGPAETLLESELQQSGTELVHHYAAAVATKP